MIALIVVSRRLKVVQESAESSKVASDGGCSSKFAQNIALPKDPTVFQDLSVDELNSVRDYILKQKALNVKSHKSASVKDNVIFLIENYLPTKADILNHLDKNGQKPKRRARVVLLNGAKTIPNIEEYVVEPLPNPSSHTRLKLNGHKDSIPHYYRPWTALEQKGISKLYRRATEEAYQVLKESFDFWHHNCTDRCLLGLPIGVPGSAKKGLRQSWVIFTRNIVGQNLFPVPFLLLVNHRSPNPEKWEILQVMTLKLSDLRQFSTRLNSSHEA